MKKFFSAVIIAVTAVCACNAQSVVNMNIRQNPLFEVSTNNVNVVSDGTGITLGGDLVIKGGSGNYTYHWYSASDNNLGSDENITVYAPGVYSLDVKDACDCLQTVIFNVSMAGVSEVTLEGAAITPNPTDGPVEISGFYATQIVIVNMAGAIEALIDCEGSVIRNADLSFLSKGYYIVTLTDRAGKTFVTKLIKK